MRDLIHAQLQEGHEVGVICDNNTGGSFEEERLAELKPMLSLGLHRISMERRIGPKDISVLWNLFKTIKSSKADILHAHGAKGGAYVRVIGTLSGSKKTRPKRLYCPHGGSIHYNEKSLSGRVYFGIERFLERFTDRLIFVSSYEQNGYFKKVGKARCSYSLVRNGLTEDDFTPVKTQQNATDFIFIGMMRDLKGVDLFLEALPLVAKKTGRPISATLVGDGPDLDKYKLHAEGFEDEVSTTFLDPIPAREAFGLGKTLLIPSRAESMPYIVLEAMAAQQPLLATRAGGIPEIYAEFSRSLIEPNNLDELVRAMASQINGTLNMPSTKLLKKRVEDDFTVEIMARQMMQAYQDTI